MFPSACIRVCQHEEAFYTSFVKQNQQNTTNELQPCLNSLMQKQLEHQSK